MDCLQGFTGTLFGISMITGILLRHFMSKHGGMLHIRDVHVFMCCQFVNLGFTLKDETYKKYNSLLPLGIMPCILVKLHCFLK